MKKRSAERCGSTGLFAKISLFLLVMSTILLPVHGEITKKILFVDDNYYSQYAGDAATAERYFLAQGFTPMTAPEILDFMKKGKAPGSVILVHDIHASTIDALEGIVTGLQARGFKLVTVSELMAIGKREAEAAAAPEAPAVPEPAAPAATPEPVAPAEPAPAEPAPEVVQPAPAAPVVVPDAVDSHASSDDETPLDLESLDLNEL